MDNAIFASDNNIFPTAPAWDNPDLWGGGKGSELNGVLGVTAPNELLLGPYANEMENLIVYDNGKIRTRRSGETENLGTSTTPPTSSTPSPTTASSDPVTPPVYSTTPTSSGNTGNYTIWIILSVVIVFIIVVVLCVKYGLKKHVKNFGLGGKANSTFDNKMSTFISENVISHMDDEM